MSRRLQVVLSEPEWRELQKAARAQRLTVAEWVRQALRTARRGAASSSADGKLAAIRTAVRYSFPSGSVEQMNEEIAGGYLSDQSR